MNKIPTLFENKEKLLRMLRLLCCLSCKGDYHDSRYRVLFCILP